MEDAFIALVKKLDYLHDKYTRGDTVHDSSYALVIKTTWRIVALDAFIALVRKLSEPHDKYTRGDTVQDSYHALVITWMIAAYDAYIAMMKKLDDSQCIVN